MRIIGCDLHARQQTLAMLDTVTGDEVLGMIWRFGTGHPDARFRRSRPKRLGGGPARDQSRTREVTRMIAR